MPPTLPVNATPSSSSNFQSIFNAALKAYEKKTKRDLLAHPLSSKLQTCNSPSSILTVLQSQVDDIDQARKTDERLTKWLSPMVNVLLVFSNTLGEGVSLVRLKVMLFWDNGFNSDDAGFLTRESYLRRCWCPPPGLYLSRRLFATGPDTEAPQAAKDVISAQDVLIDIFERIEYFFKRLETYTEVRPSAAMTDIIVAIMVEVLNVMAIATKEIKQGRTSELSTADSCICTGSADRPSEKYLKQLVGKTDIEDALRRLDKLTQEEVRMATAQLLELTHGVSDKVKDVGDTVKLVLDGAQCVKFFY
jgi:hypothetical protein